MVDRVNDNNEYVQGNLSKSGPDHMASVPKLGSPVATATTGKPLLMIQLQWLKLPFGLFRCLVLIEEPLQL